MSEELAPDNVSTRSDSSQQSSESSIFMESQPDTR